MKLTRLHGFSSQFKKTRPINFSYLHLLISNFHLNRSVKFAEKHIDHSKTYNSFTGRYEAELKTVYRAYYYFQNTSLDILIYANLILKKNKSLIRIRYLRYLSVILYEVLDDLNSIINQETFRVIEQTENYMVINNLKKVLEEIKFFRKQWKNELGLLRNAVGAHRECNVLLYEEYEKELNYKTILVLSNLLNSFIVNISTCMLITLDDLSKKQDF